MLFCVTSRLCSCDLGDSLDVNYCVLGPQAVTNGQPRTKLTSPYSLLFALTPTYPLQTNSLQIKLTPTSRSLDENDSLLSIRALN